MKTKLDSRIFMAIFLLFLSTGIIYFSFGYGSSGKFPRIVGVGLLISVGCWMLEIFKEGYNDETNGDKKNQLGVVAIVGILILYTSLIELIGYIISTIILGICTIYLLGYRNMSKIAIYILLTVLFVFFIFKVLLKVNLPTILLTL